MRRAILAGIFSLSSSCWSSAVVAEDVCISIPNGIMCGPIVPNPGVAIRSSSSQPADQGDRPDVRSGQRSVDYPDQRNGVHRDVPADERRGERIDRRRSDYRFQSGERSRYERELRRERIDERRYDFRDRKGRIESERRFDGRDPYRQRVQESHERRFDDHRRMQRRFQRNDGREFEDRHRYGHRVDRQRLQRQAPIYDERYYDRRRD